MSPDRDPPDAHLDPAALATLAAHLGRCDACRSRLAGAVQVVELATDNIADAPPSEADPSEAPAPPEPAAPGPGPIADVLRAVEALRADFEAKIRYDGGREAMIDRLHQELQEHKADLHLKILRPFALELIGLHDDLGKRLAARAEAEPDADAPAIAEALQSVRDDLEDLLYRCGFEAFVTDTPQFDPRRQRALRTVPAADPALDRHVARRLRKGFAYEGRVIRPELVDVHVATPPAPPAPTTT
jgi:molecular chaperone GrpE